MRGRSKSISLLLLVSVLTFALGVQIIVDPAGLGVLASAEDQLLAETGRSVVILQLVSAAVMLAGGSYLLRRVYA